MRVHKCEAGLLCEIGHGQQVRIFYYHLAKIINFYVLNAAFSDFIFILAAILDF